MTWLTIIVGIIIVWYLIRVLGSKLIYYKKTRIEDFPRFLGSLMVQFDDGGLLFFQHEGSDRFLQFVKYIQDGKESLNFGFPDAPWSRMYFDRVKECLQSGNISFEITKTEREDTRSFLDVYDISSIEEASKISILVIQAMGLSSEDTFTTHFEGKFNMKVWRANSDKYNKYLKRHLTSHSS